MTTNNLPKNILYVVPDTSWLLNARPNEIGRVYLRVPLANRLSPAWRAVTLPLRIPCKILLGALNNGVGGYIMIPATYILLDEVVQEITGLHAGEKMVGTGNAKNVIREIMNSHHFERQSARETPRVPLIEGRLGLDSDTDHAILSSAIALSVITPVTQVVVLTNDTGLKLEIASQQREKGYRIWSDTNTLHGYGYSNNKSLGEYYSQVSEFLVREHGIGRVI